MQEKPLNNYLPPNVRDSDIDDAIERDSDRMISVAFEVAMLNPEPPKRTV